MRKQYSAPPPLTIDTAKQYTATFDTTRGQIVCDLFAADAPMTVNNFVFLAREGFYDGTVFHRVFGQVRSGQEVVNAIRQGDTLNRVTIEEA
jgi:cyclophilin family peptidyl-prolyl cis-trans isomerase